LKGLEHVQDILPPTSLEAIIGMAAGFDDNVYDQLNALVQKPTATDPSDDDLRALSDAAGVPEKQVRYFLSFLDFLFSQTADIEPSELESTLLAFLTENGDSSEVERVAGKLKMLLSHRDIQENAEKLARLRDGLLPNITGLANFVDIRNDFGRDEAGELNGMLGSAIPVIQIGIRTNSVKTHERELLLQLDEKALDRLQDCIDEIRKKLEILNAK
jgi:uncharacterized protein YfkK (UPF0435 family)